MADKLNVSILMQLIDKISAPVKSISASIGAASKAFEHFGSKAEKAFDAAAKMKLAHEAISELSNKMQELVAIPIEDATKFQTAMVELGNASGITGDAVGKVGDAVQRLATGTEFTSTEVAKSLTLLRRSGLDVNDATAQMPKVMEFATASSLSLGEAASRVGGILKGFRLSASETGHATDVLSSAARTAGIPVDQFSSVLASIGPVARTMGVSLDSTAATMALLGKAGLSGEEGAGALHSILTRLADPRGARLRAQAFSFLGISAADAKKNIGDLPGLLELIQKKTAGMSALNRQAVISSLFGREAAGSINALFSSMKPGTIDELRKSLAGAGGTTEEFARAMDETAEVSEKKFHASLTNLGTSLGTLILPMATSFVGKLANLVTGITRWTQAHPGLTRALATLFLGLTSVVTAISSLVGIISAAKTIQGFYFLARGYAAFSAVLLANPIMLVIVAIAALAAAVAYLVTHWEIVTGAVERFKKASLGAKIMLGLLFGPLLLILSPIIAIAAAIRTVIDHWDEWGRKIDEVVGKLEANPIFKTLVSEPAAALSQLLAPAIDAGKEAVGVLTGPQTQKSEHKVRVELGNGLQAKTIESKGNDQGIDFDAGPAMVGQ